MSLDPDFLNYEGKDGVRILVFLNVCLCITHLKSLKYYKIMQQPF